MISSKDLAELIHNTQHFEHDDSMYVIDPDDLINSLIIYFKGQDDNGIYEFNEEEFIEDCGGYCN